MKKFKFTADEKENLSIHLHNYQKDSVRRFLIELEAICRQRSYLVPLPDLAAHRKDIERIATNIKAVLNDLRRITAKKRPFNVLPQVLFADMRGKKIGRIASLNFDAVDKAAVAHNALVGFDELLDEAQKILKAEKPDPNRPSSDVNGFIMEVGESFFMYFGEIQSSKEGVFGHVIYEILKILELRKPIKDQRPVKMPQRAIERVARAIKARK